MNSRGTATLAVVALALVVGAGTVLALEALQPPDRAGHGQEFQRLLGGLGFGSAPDPAVCPCAFDPRLEGACAFDLGPVPGGAAFCPYHAGTVLSCPPLPAPGAAGEEAGGDARLP